MDEVRALDITDWQCPTCGQIGGGIIFFAEHAHTCNEWDITADESNRVRDVSYEEVIPKQLTDGKTRY